MAGRFRNLQRSRGRIVSAVDGVILQPPVNTVAPVVSGDLTEGATLSVTNGTWNNSPSSYAYNWRWRDGGPWQNTGITTQTFDIPTGYGGRQIICTVSATNDDGTGTANSNVVSVEIVLNPPENTVAPEITFNNLVEGETLSVTDGTWTNSPDTFEYDWQWNDGGGWVSTGETAQSFVLPSGYEGRNIRCEVTASNDDGEASEFSNSVGPVEAIPYPPENTVAPTISGDLTEGDTLSATNGTWTNSPDTFEYDWQWSDGGEWNSSGIVTQTFDIPTGYEGRFIRCEVTAINDDGEGSEVSNSLGPVEAVLYPPENTVAPVVSGDAIEGETLSVTDGTWTNSPDTFEYNWQWSDGGAWTDSGTTTQTFDIPTGYEGRNIRCEVTASNDDGEASEFSNSVGPVEAALPAGPERTASARSDTFAFEGNSQLVIIPGPEHGGQFETIIENPTPGPAGVVATTFVAGGSLGGIDDGSEISSSVWAADGAGRNADFSNGGLLCINEGLTSGQFATGFPDPGTAQDNVTLQYVGGYLREATRLGADGLVIVSNYPHRDYPLWDEPLQHAQFWRQHAMMHNPGDVWIFPFSLLVEDAVDYYGSNAFYADPVHQNESAYPELIAAYSYAFEYFCTKALPVNYGSLTGDTLALVDRFMPIIASYRYSGFGGNQAPDDLLYNGEPLSELNDPLPSPGLLPGEGGSSGETPIIEFTDTTYSGGAAIQGALPAASGGHRSFTAGDPNPVVSLPCVLDGVGYMIARIRSPSPVSASGLVYMFTAQNGVYGAWPGFAMVGYGAVTDWVAGLVDTGANTNAVSGENISGDWQTVEVWADGDETWISVDGSTPVLAATGGTGVWTTTQLHIARTEGAGAHVMDVRRFRMFDVIPVDQAAQRTWVETTS